MENLTWKTENVIKSKIENKIIKKSSTFGFRMTWFFKLLSDFVLVLDMTHQ